MRACRYCGHPNEDDANFCNHCGKVIGIGAPPAFRFYELNRQSTSNEIGAAMKSEYTIQLREGLKQINNLKDLLQQSFNKAPIKIFTPEQLIFWRLLDQAQWEILEIQAAYRAVEYLFGILLQAIDYDINLENYKEAKRQWMNEISEEILITPIHLVEKHDHTLTNLHMSYINSIPAK